jgi:hypothetical protein
MFEQSNQSNHGRADLVVAAREVLPRQYARFRRGMTQLVPGRAIPAANEFAFHWVDTAALGRAIGVRGAGQGDYYAWHDSIHALFLEAAFRYCRHSFHR